MVTKKRYDKRVSNDQSLKRIFSSSNSSKYPTLGRFLPSFSKQTTVFNSHDDQVVDKDNDLDLLDQLVSQTLLSKTDTAPTEVSYKPQAVGRTKEILGSQVSTEANSVVESSQESPAEFISNPELTELSKEIKEVSQETKEQREQALIKEKQKEIDNLATEATTPVAVSNRPVVVLPITAQSKEEAKFKTTKYSVRWLIEWCKKVAKMFSGAVVYKEEVDYE